MMVEILEPQPGDTILDVGCGSAWSTAILRHIAGAKGRVFGVEIRPELVTLGRNNLKNCPGYGNAEIRQARRDVIGLPREAPFDRIMVSAGRGSEIPADLKRQLKIGGKMILPVDGALLACTKLKEDRYHIETREGYTFVPLIEGGEKLFERKRVYIAGQAAPTLADNLRRLGYEAQWPRLGRLQSGSPSPGDRALQQSFEAYESDVTIIMDEGAGRIERRVLLGAAVGAAIAGKEKDIYLVGSSADRSEFANLPYVRTFKTTAECLAYLQEADFRSEKAANPPKIA